MLAVNSVQNLYPITSSAIYTTIIILCFLHWCETQSPIIRENKKFMMFATMVLKRTSCYM